MKKLHSIIPVCILFMLLLHSCSGLGPTRTSLVTITIGSSSSAAIQVLPANTWARLKHFIAGLLQTTTASAAIPSMVSDIKVTVSAADITNIITLVPVAELPSVTITIEVPNGTNRTFLVEGLAASGVVAYRGQTTADLTGEPVSLAITLTGLNPPTFAGLVSASILTISSSQLQWNAATDVVSPSANIVYLIYQATTPMGELFTTPTYTSPAGATSFTVSNLTPGTIYYFVVRAMNEAGIIDNNIVERSFVYPGLYVATSGSDTTGTGTQANPYQTISKALTATPGNEGVFVSAGTYTPVTTLQLKAGTALACTGPGHTTIIYRPISGTPVAIAGNVAAIIDGCTVAETGTLVVNPLIDDTLGATTINNTLVECSLNNTNIGIALQNNSAVMNSRMSNCAYNASPGYGISITGGSALISSNTFTANIGAIQVSGGAPTIANNTINYNTGNGITITVGVGSPAPIITANTINNNLNGIVVSGGTSTISSNMIDSNSSIGISMTGGTAFINNNLVSTNGTGISISNVSPVINGNTIISNSTGISVIGSPASPAINNNSIYCNTTTDLNLAGTISVDATANSWDHDSKTSPVGPTTAAAGCAGGVDICLGGSVSYSPSNSAVPVPPACR
jgi:hypothetical protein